MAKMQYIHVWQCQNEPVIFYNKHITIERADSELCGGMPLQCQLLGRLELGAHSVPWSSAPAWAAWHDFVSKQRNVSPGPGVAISDNMLTWHMLGHRFNSLRITHRHSGDSHSGLDVCQQFEWLWVLLGRESGRRQGYRPQYLGLAKEQRNYGVPGLRTVLGDWGDSSRKHGNLSLDPPTPM